MERNERGDEGLNEEDAHGKIQHILKENEGDGQKHDYYGPGENEMLNSLVVER